MNHGFPPVSRPNARVLILGSMPGEASLAAQQYYAHPRNSFWPIMGAVLGFDAALPYAQRLDHLMHKRVALWDVLGACRRTGSLDSAIVADSIQINPFSTFLRDHSEIERILFNGSAACTLFRRQVLPSLGAASEGIAPVRLPSTSPAHAAMTYSLKLQAWRDALS